MALMLLALIPGDPPGDRLLIRLTMGSGIEAIPSTPLASIFASGRYEGPESKGQRTPKDAKSLRTKLKRLASITQAGLDKEIAASGLPAPSMRNDSPLHGLETSPGRLLFLRAPNHYRGKGLPKVDAFLAALDEVAKFAAVRLRG